jgi:amidohydrolase
MNWFLQRSLGLESQTVHDRRMIHGLGGIGFDLRPSADYIEERLKKLGIDFTESVPCGIVATIGKGKKVFLVRADYDALPMQEQTGLPFAATNGSCHACGHDFHSSMLLCAAQMLKERETDLNGAIKLMFQPAEECGCGAAAMISAGVLENPDVNAAMAIHIAVGTTISDSCTVHYSRGPAYSSGSAIKIGIKGKGGHGAAPHNTVDPISIAAYVITSLQEISAREIPPGERVVLTFGSIHGGTAGNVITDEVNILGTLRTFSLDMRDFMTRRIKEITDGVAQSMRGNAIVEISQSFEPVINDSALCDILFPYIEEVTGVGKTAIIDYPSSYGSEDFALVANKVPSVALKLGVGSPKEGYSLPIHHPAALFDEKALPYGAAVYANCAFRWLKDSTPIE